MTARREQPSMTAAVVAATLLLAWEDTALRDLVDYDGLDAVREAVRYTMPGAAWALDYLPWSLVRRIGAGIEHIVSPGFIAHYALRKAAIREQLRRAVSEGFRQVVLLGAGFDMLSASLPDHVDVFEVDTPATQRAKREALRHIRTRGVRYLPADLSEVRLRDVLERAPDFDHRCDTAFVAEGLLMYLDARIVQGVLSDLVSEQRRTRAIFSCITPDAAGRLRMHSQRAIVDQCMRLLNEEFVWGEAIEATRVRLETSSLHVDGFVRNAELIAELRRKTGRRLRSSGEVIVIASHDAQARSALAAELRTQSR